MKALKILFGVCLALFVCVQARGADSKFSYDHFYNSDPEFKKGDKELNAKYKELMNSLDWQDKFVLRDEQRKWHNKLFPIMVESGAFSGSAQATARDVLDARVKDFDKFLNSSKADNILGMPIDFGLSREEVASRLGITEAMLDATPQDDGGAYKIKLFDQEVAVFFKFLKTTFNAGENVNNERFKEFLNAAGGSKSIFPGINVKKTSSAVVTSLVEVDTGGLPSRKDFGIMNEELEKKYKRAYPQYANMAALIDDNDYLMEGLEDDNLANSSTQYAYEDASRYVMTNGSWGTMDGDFNITYVSRPYLTYHLESARGVAAEFNEVDKYKDGLVILPNRAPLKIVLDAIGGRELAWTPEAGVYYSLFGEYPVGDGSESLMVYMTPDNRAFAVTFSFINENALAGFVEGLEAKWAKKYHRLKTTPQGVMDMLEHVSDDDLDFESDENYIHVGSTPHFAVQLELTVVNKKELESYLKVKAAQDAKEAEAREEHDERVREESSKF